MDCGGASGCREAEKRGEWGGGGQQASAVQAGRLGLHHSRRGRWQADVPPQTSLAAISTCARGPRRAGAALCSSHLEMQSHLAKPVVHRLRPAVLAARLVHQVLRGEAGSPGGVERGCAKRVQGLQRLIPDHARPNF